MENTIKKNYDAIIIGAGPAGCATALSLSQKNKSILILEADPETSRFAGEWLHPPGVDVLRKLNLGQLVDNPSRPRGKGFVVYPADKSEPILLDYPDNKKALSFVHSDFVDDFRLELQKNRLIQYVPFAKVEKIEKDTLNICIKKSEKGECTDEQYTASAPLIVGAEGRSSLVRKKFNYLPTGKVISLMMGVLLEDVDLPFPDYGHVLLGKPGFILAYPIGPKMTRLCIDVPLKYKDKIKDLNWVIENFTHLLPISLQNKFIEQIKAKKVEWKSNSFLTRNFYGDGKYVLVGDAAGHTHPITAAGITNGLLDADAFGESKNFLEFKKKRTRMSLVPEVLSRALYECFSRTDPTALDLQKATYSLWKKHPKEKIRTMGLLMCAPPSIYDFVAPFSKVLAMGTGIRLKQHFALKKWHHIPKEILFILEWVKLPFAYALARVPKSMRSPIASTYTRLANRF